MKTALGRLLGISVIQAALFCVLAVVVVDGLPLKLVAGPQSQFGSRPLKEVFGGVNELELEVSLKTLNAFLAVDELTREEWLDFYLSQTPADASEDLWPEEDDGAVDTDTSEDVAPTKIESPEVWPLQGEFGLACRPALALATAAGLTLDELHFESPVVGSLDPLCISIGRSASSWLLLLLAPFVTFLLVRGRGLMEGLTTGILGVGLVGIFAGLGVVFWDGTPSLVDPWQAYVDTLMAQGAVRPFDLWTDANIKSVLSCAGVFVLSAALSARGTRAPLPRTD